MISKNRLKLLHSLERKKGRQETGLFVAEGPKLVGELLQRYSPTYVAALPAWWQEHAALQPQVEHDVLTPEELSRASLLQAPQLVIATFRIPQHDVHIADVAENELCLALDGVQDPGNVGTIVRLADWFGIRHVFLSPQSADIYNPKATQATMGALARVAVHTVMLQQELRDLPCPIYGTFLDGDNMYETPLEQRGVIVMGNEGRGVSPEVGSLVSHRLYIPPYPTDCDTVESLNVAMATGIICAEFRRRA